MSMQFVAGSLLSYHRVQFVCPAIGTNAHNGLVKKCHKRSVDLVRGILALLLAANRKAFTPFYPHSFCLVWMGGDTHHAACKLEI